VIGEARFYIKVAPQYSPKVAAALRSRARCGRRETLFDLLKYRFSGLAVGSRSALPRPVPNDRSAIADKQRDARRNTVVITRRIVYPDADFD
jgi:hypothetical protein